MRVNLISIPLSNIYIDSFFTLDHQIAFFRVYDDISIFVVSNEDDNELVISEVLDTLHEWFDEAFAHIIDRENLTNNMTAVILIIDELIDNGIIMTLESATILERTNIKFSDFKGSKKEKDEKKDEDKPAESTGGYYSFTSVFSNAKNSLAKTLAL